MEIEHAILIVGSEREKIKSLLLADGYDHMEIDRAVAAAVRHGHIEEPDKEHLGIAPSRREQARRYFLLDLAAIEGETLTLVQSSASGLVMVPGYGPFHGLMSKELRKLAEARARSLITDWSVAGIYDSDLAWLDGRGYAVVNP